MCDVTDICGDKSLGGCDGLVLWYVPWFVDSWYWSSLISINVTVSSPSELLISSTFIGLTSEVVWNLWLCMPESHSCWVICCVQNPPVMYNTGCLPLGLSPEGNSGCTTSFSCSHEHVHGTACCPVLLPLFQFFPIDVGMVWLGFVFGLIFQAVIPQVGDCVL